MVSPWIIASIILVIFIIIAIVVIIGFTQGWWGTGSGDGSGSGGGEDGGEDEERNWNGSLDDLVGKKVVLKGLSGYYMVTDCSTDDKYIGGSYVAVNSEVRNDACLWILGSDKIFSNGDYTFKSVKNDEYLTIKGVSMGTVTVPSKSLGKAPYHYGLINLDTRDVDGFIFREYEDFYTYLTKDIVCLSSGLKQGLARPWKNEDSYSQLDLIKIIPV